MNCRICTHTTEDPIPVTIYKYGQVHICQDCIADIVFDAVKGREQWRKDFCRGCPQATESGCLQGVTPETCA